MKNENVKIGDVFSHFKQRSPVITFSTEVKVWYLKGLSGKSQRAGFLIYLRNTNKVQVLKYSDQSDPNTEVLLKLSRSQIIIHF